MDFDQIDFSNLPPDRDRAFVYLESKFSEVYEGSRELTKKQTRMSTEIMSEHLNLNGRM